MFPQKVPKRITRAIAIGTNRDAYSRVSRRRPGQRCQASCRTSTNEHSILSLCIFAFNAGELALRVLYFLNLLRSPDPRTDVDVHPPEALPPCSA